MKNLTILGLAILAIFFGSCEFESYKDYRTPEYDGIFS